VTGALYPMAIQYGYGEIWFRPGLDLRQRALVAVAAFTALKLDSQAKSSAIGAEPGPHSYRGYRGHRADRTLSGFRAGFECLGRFERGAG